MEFGHLPPRVDAAFKRYIRAEVGFARLEPRAKLYPTFVKDQAYVGNVRAAYIVKYPNGFVRPLPMTPEEARLLCRDRAWLVEVKPWSTKLNRLKPVKKVDSEPDQVKPGADTTEGVWFTERMKASQ